MVFRGVREMRILVVDPVTISVVLDTSVRGRRSVPMPMRLPVFRMAPAVVMRVRMHVRDTCCSRRPRRVDLTSQMDGHQ